jgi:hypothetical protein
MRFTAWSWITRGIRTMLNQRPVLGGITMHNLPASSHGKSVDVFHDDAALEIEFRRVVKGEVRFDHGSRAMYAVDGSNYRQIPIGLVIPKDKEDVIAAVGACRKFDAPILPRGGGTSLAGQCCNVAVVLDFSKYMHALLELTLRRVTPRAARYCARHVAQRRRETPSHLRARSEDAQSLHARRSPARSLYRRHLRINSRSQSAFGAQPAAQVTGRARLSRRLRHEAITCRLFWSTSRSVWKVSMAALLK